MGGWWAGRLEWARGGRGDWSGRVGGAPAVGGWAGREVGESGRDASPLQELGELAAVGKARAAHPDVLLQAQVLHLVLDPGERAA